MVFFAGKPHQKSVWRQQQLANNHPANNHQALVAPQGAEAQEGAEAQDEGAEVQHEPALEDDEEVEEEEGYVTAAEALDQEVQGANPPAQEVGERFFSNPTYVLVGKN